MSDTRSSQHVGARSALRAIAYVRVSTGDQEENGFSLGSQETAIAREVERREWSLVSTFTEAKSGKLARNRPVLQRALDLLANGEADALVVARLDRLARSLIDLLTLMQRAEREGWVLLVLSPSVDMSDPFGRCMAQMAGAFAELESALIGERQKESIAARRAAGTYRPPAAQLDPAAEERITHLSEDGWGVRRIAQQLELEGFRPPRADRWHPSTVQATVQRLAARG